MTYTCKKCDRECAEGQIHYCDPQIFRMPVHDPFVEIRVCGCWILKAGKGHTIVLCERHEDGVIRLVKG
jgi:hypothetical protein